MEYPIVAGLGLADAEERLVELWLARHAAFHKRARLSPRELSGPPCFYPALSFDELEEILGWGLPLLVVSGAKTASKDERELFRRGAAACWTIPSKERPLIFPELELPRIGAGVFAIADDARLRFLYRQILRFAGLDLRADFRSSDEIVETMRRLHEENSDTVAYPDLILLDLDSSRTDAGSFFYRLRQLLRDYPDLKNASRVLLTRDFAKPGPDISALAKNVRPFVRRVFHPRESLFALMEAYLFFSRRSAPIHFSSFEYRSVSELLHGSRAVLPAKSPGELLNFFEGELNSLRRSLPFLRLYDFLREDSGREGALLAAQPEIDAGNALDGVRGPDAAGEPVQDVSE